MNEFAISILRSYLAYRTKDEQESICSAIQQLQNPKEWTDEDMEHIFNEGVIYACDTTTVKEDIEVFRERIADYRKQRESKNA